MECVQLWSGRETYTESLGDGVKVFAGIIVQLNDVHRIIISRHSNVEIESCESFSFAFSVSVSFREKVRTFSVSSLDHQRDTKTLRAEDDTCCLRVLWWTSKCVWFMSLGEATKKMQQM
jgi:hypothetical protein